jgi:hypothetical protein
MATKKELEDKILVLESEISELKQQSKPVGPEKIIDIVYPNVAHLSQWEELKYSLRSVEKNFRDIPYRVFIVGDMPEWADERIAHIPCPHSGKTPRIDILYKHEAVRKSGLIGEEYIWMNDDIYFVNPVQYADFCLNVARGSLRSAISHMNRQTIWGRDNSITLTLLEELKMPSWNYAIHIPHRYEKKKVLKMIEIFNMLERPVVLEQVYYNYWFRDMRPYQASLDIGNNITFSINRPNPSSSALKSQLQVKKFMNNGEAGMSDTLKLLLKRLFPDRSIFEKP